MPDRNHQPPAAEEPRNSLAIRFSAAERETLRRAAERKGWPLSTYIRRAALKAAQPRKAA
jgi:uncharacterized protein (DUF1778 family)